MNMRYKYCGLRTDSEEATQQFVSIPVDLLKEIDLYFKSGNNVNPDRATIPYTKWEPISKILRETISKNVVDN